MLEKSSAIILNQVKYTDSGAVIQAFTRRFGRMSIMVKGIRNRKAGRHPVFLQPLSVLDLELYFREARQMQSLKEFTVPVAMSGIQSNIIKSTMAIFLGEVLSSVLREETPQEDLFDFVCDAIKYLDTRNEGYSNFHIAFMCSLLSYLGFEPSPQKDSEDIFFDLNDGRFMKLRPAHGEFEGLPVSNMLAAFFRSSWDGMNSIPLTGTERNSVLETLLRYYAVHLPRAGKIRSAAVLREVFG
jgi:DNA repair protein RecO (recombination protein O)